VVWFIFTIYFLI